jgi:hypothetical protein
MNWTRLFSSAILVTGAAFAQGWDLGAAGGFSYAPNLSVTEASATASVGIGRGGVAGAYLGEDMYRYFGGELRYLYGFGDLQASSGNTSVSFGRRFHIVTFDILSYLRPPESRVRPFLALGGGAEILEGTGAESASQPLGNFVALTHTRETLAAGDVGLGFKIGLSRRLSFRIEAHDYMGPSPGKVIAPAPGASISGFMNNIVATASIAWTWRETEPR